MEKRNYLNGYAEKNTSRLVLSCGCNQNCLFCDAGHLGFDDRAELIAEELSSDSLAGRVSVTGGEPTLDPRLPGLIRKIKKNKLKHVAILTNGLRFASRRYLDSIKSAGMDEVVLSFFESDADRYDLLANAPGAFVKKIAAMENLRQSGTKTKINLLVYSGNQTSAARIVEWLYGKYGIKEFALSVLEPDCERVQANPWLIPDIKVVLKSLSRIAVYCGKNGISCMVPANGAIPRCAADTLGVKYPGGIIKGADIQEKVRIKPAGLCAGCGHMAACAGIIRHYALGLAGFLRKKKRNV